MTYAEILEFVFSNGRIETNAEEDWDTFLAEVATEVQFEASERFEAGELEGTVEGAVEFALSHVGWGSHKRSAVSQAESALRKVKRSI